jgi:hypothetical protein
MNVVAKCEVDTLRRLQLDYEDLVSNIWHGDVNFAGLAWRGTSASVVTVGSMTFVLATLLGGEEVCFGYGVLADGASFALPTGFDSTKMFAQAFPHDATPKPNRDAHGIEAYVDPSTNTVHLNFKGTGNNDSTPDTWHGNAAVLVFAWKNNSGTVTTIAITGGEWMLCPLSNGKVVAIGFARIPNGQQLELPSLTQPTVLDSATVTITPKSYPWSPITNPSLDFGVHDGTAPIIVPVTIAAGNTVKIRVTGTIRVSDARPPYGPKGGGFVTGVQKGSTGTYFPTRRIPNSSLLLGGVCGAWVDGSGNVVGDPFDVGDEVTLIAPAGALHPALGVNDDKDADNTGAGFTAEVTVLDTPDPAIAGGRLQTITSPRSFTDIGSHAHGVKASYVGADRVIAMSYGDDENHTWFGDAEVFACMVQESTTEPIAVEITPPSASIATGATQQFTAAVTGTPNQAVAWAVDGILGGNSVVGLITTNGLYTAPASPGTHTVRATSMEDGTSHDEATVIVGGSIPDQGGFLVNGFGSVPTDTTLADQTAHNSSASPIYNKDNFPKNFTRDDLHHPGGSHRSDRFDEDGRFAQSGHSRSHFRY